MMPSSNPVYSLQRQPLTHSELLWAQREMAGAHVTHGKERTSLVGITASLAKYPTLAFSTATGHAGRQAAYRIFAKSQITVSMLMQGHYEQSAQRIRQFVKPGSLVLVAQDTMVVDFSTHLSTTGLGPINDGGLGSFAHGALCLTEDGLPLGVVDLLIWARDPQEPGKRKDKRKKPYSQKESFKWAHVLSNVQARIDAQHPVLLMQDREADIFAFMAQPRRDNVDLLIRASEPRNVLVVEPEPEAGNQKEAGEPTAETVSLFEAVEQAPEMGTYTITVPRRAGQKERQAVLTLRLQEVTIPAPQNGHKTDPKQAQQAWVIQACEQKPPAGTTAIVWTLISTMEVTTAEEARVMVLRYTRRWVIERLHYTLKSGCSVERLQIDDAWSLHNAIAIYYIVAWRLLHLTYLGRMPGDVSVDHVLAPDEITVLTHLSGSTLTKASQAVAAIAKLGGYTYSRTAPPGVKVLWLGLRHLQGMVEGYRLALQAHGLMKQD
jgi:hypothetical protein